MKHENLLDIFSIKIHLLKKLPNKSSKRTVIEAMNSDLNLNINNFYINMRRYMDLAFIGEFFLVNVS